MLLHVPHVARTLDGFEHANVAGEDQLGRRARVLHSQVFLVGARLDAGVVTVRTLVRALACVAHFVASQRVVIC